MRAKSNETDGYIIYAVSGTNTISFAIDFRNADTNGLLGFSVERIDKTHGKRKYLNGYKVFRELIKDPTPETYVSTCDHPIQSFVWDDFACYNDTEYEYLFHPMKGSPQNPDRNFNPISVKISTEKLFSDSEHDIFFNRGVASSQAYCREFNNIPPIDIADPVKRKEAWDWLSRELDDAILKFIKQAKKGDTLLGCFYEFHYEPVVKAFKEAIKKGAIVKIIIDAKVNECTRNGVFIESFPREKNLKTLEEVGISINPADGIVYYREAKKNDIQHNKFMVLIEKMKGNLPTQVWTGSTNISLGGIHGQTNVGHWIRSPKVAEKYEKYWEILSDDPGAQDQDDRSTKTSKNNALKKQIESLQKNIEFTSLGDIPDGITPVFSPRRGLSMLDTYVKTMDNAKDISCVTLAFGINKIFKENLKDNTNKDHITFLLLEKEDKPKKKSKDPFVYIGAKNNVYKSWGAYIEDILYKWAKETSTRSLKLNQHVAYIHSKFMLVDPLSSDPIIVSGSANFSEASTNNNDENMVIIRGNQRAADIYFTEFNRIFNHYYFRAVYNNAKEKKRTDSESIFLKPDDSWLDKYSFGKLRYKRVEMLSKMTGFNQ